MILLQMFIWNVAGDKILNVVSINHNCTIEELWSVHIQFVGIIDKHLSFGYKSISNIYQDFDPKDETPVKTCSEIADWLGQSNFKN